MSDLIDVSAFLNSLEPADREEELARLRELTKFCWDCGSDFSDDRRVCHCTNDE